MGWYYIIAYHSIPYHITLYYMFPYCNMLYYFNSYCTMKYYDLRNYDNKCSFDGISHYNTLSIVSYGNVLFYGKVYHGTAFPGTEYYDSVGGHIPHYVL